MSQINFTRSVLLQQGGEDAADEYFVAPTFDFFTNVCHELDLGDQCEDRLIEECMAKCIPDGELDLNNEQCSQTLGEVQGVPLTCQHVLIQAPELSQLFSGMRETLKSSSYDINTLLAYEQSSLEADLLSQLFADNFDNLEMLLPGDFLEEGDLEEGDLEEGDLEEDPGLPEPGRAFV
jgi:hypothetical protein